MSDRKDVVILMGGPSREREVSLVTGRAVMEAIDTARFNARAVELSASLNASAKSRLSPSGSAVSLLEPLADLTAYQQIVEALSTQPDIVFIAMHGRYGEDGCVQGLLETAGVPYTGSGVLASALAMDKIASKAVLRNAGIPTPDWLVVTSESASSVDSKSRRYPVIVKPNREGSTNGASIVRDSAELAPAIEEALRFDSSVLIEQFVSGKEITVGVLGNSDPEALPVIEIRPKSGFFDYEAKYTAGMTEKIVPAQLPADVYQLAQDYALRAHSILGCVGMSRVDFIVSEDGPVCLEVNTIPGMTPTSLLPRAAEAAGMSFTSLISRIIDLGLETKR